MISKFFCRPIGGLLTLSVMLVSSSFGTVPVTVNTVVRTGLWSVLNNPAGLAPEDRVAAGFFHSQTFLLKELSTSAFGFSVPVKKRGAFGVGYSQFGYSLYRSRNARLCYAMHLGKSVDAGVGIDYYSIKFGNEYGGAATFTGSAGLQIRVTPELKAGFYVYNPQRARLSGTAAERIPSHAAVAFAWIFGTHAELNFGIEKWSDAKEQLQCGFDYHLSDKFALNAGIATGKDAFRFGFEYRMGSVNFQCASGYHVVTGFSPQFSMIFKKH